MLDRLLVRLISLLLYVATVSPFLIPGPVIIQHGPVDRTPKPEPRWMWESKHIRPPVSLDGKSFEGKIYWSMFPFSLLRFNDVIEFKEGAISSTLSVSSGYKQAPYKTRVEDGNIIFTARAVREENDYFDWSGVYDGVSISEAKMVWTKDGKVRTYRFKEKYKEK